MLRGDFDDESSELVSRFHSKEPIRCNEFSTQANQDPPTHISLPVVLVLQLSTRYVRRLVKWEGRIK